MKQKLTYLFSLLLTALFLLPWTGVKAETLDAGAGSASNEYLPIYGWNGDNNQHNQYIIPASELEAMQNGTITGMKFYTSAGYSNPSWNSGSAPTVTFKLAEVNATTLSGLLDIELTQVWSGAVAVSSGEWNITFDSSYSYGDGNLLVDITVASNGYTHIYFVGEAITNAGFWKYGSYSSGSTSFIPKTTFTYTPGVAPTCPKTGTPEASNVGPTSATISWAVGGTEGLWNLQYKKSSEEEWTSVNGLTTNSYNLTGLAAGKTTYQYQVQADCGSGDVSGWKAGDAFQTDCGTIAIPTDGWDYDFTGASGTTPQCWTIIRTSDQAYNATIYSNSLRFEGNNSSSKKERRVVVILPAFQTDIRNLKISFKYQNKGTTTTYPQFFVGCTSSLTDVTQFKTLHTLSKYSSGMHSTGDLSLANADEGSYIAIMYTNPDGSSNDAGYSYIDDVKVESTQDCSKPATPVASNITGTSAHVAWDANDGVTSYKYYYTTSSEAPAASVWESAATTSNTYVDLSELTAGTTYYFYVMCACGDTPSDACEFTPTACPSVTGVSLDGGTYNSITVNWTTGGATNCDVRYKAGSGSWNTDNANISEDHVTISGLSVGTEYTFAVKPHCNDAEEAWVECAETYTPAYGVPGIPAISSITDASASAEWTAAAGATGYEYIAVASGDPNWASAAYTTSLNGNAISGLSAGTDYTLYVRAKYGESNYGAANSNTFSTVTIAPTGLTKGTVTDTQATYTWSANGSATKYQWACKASGTPAAGDWSAATTDLTATATGLSSYTNYTFYVRSYYSESVQSAYVSNGFKTELGTFNLPYEEAFASSIPAGWDNSVHSTDYDYWSTTSSYRVSGYSMQYYAPYATTTSADLVTPSIYLSNDANLKFYLRNNSSYGTVTGEVYIKYGTTTTKIYDIPGTSTSFEQKTIDLSDYTGETVQFIFRGHGLGSGKYASIYIDNVEVKVIPCDAPEFAAANVEATSDGAIISCAADKWNLRYKTGSDDWTTIENITTATRTLTGLTEGTEYQVQVQTVCSVTRSSDWTASQTFTPVSCPAVTGVTLDNKSYNSVTVNWTAEASTECDVRYSTDGGTNWTSAATNVSATSQAITVAVGNTYTFAVKPSCSADGWVAAGETYAPAYGVPGTPSVTSITASSASASWTAALYGATGYEYVLMPGETAADWTSPTAATSPLALDELTDGTNYTLYVRAKFGENSGDAVSANFTTATIAPAFTSTDPATTTTTATIALEAYTGSATQFQYVVMAGSAAANWAGASVVAKTESLELTGLTAGSSYTLYVRAYYGESLQSAAASKAFSTECDTKTIGWSENFDATDMRPACWSGTIAGNTKWGIYSYDAHSGSNTMRCTAYKNNSSVHADLVTPSIALSEPAQLKFFYIKSSSYVTAQVLIRIAGEEDAVIWTATNKSSWGTKADSIDLRAYTGQTANLIFRVYGSSNGSSSYFYLDDVSVVALPCPQLQNLAAVPTPDGAVITWEQGEDENRYQYCVVDAGEAADGWVLLDEDVFTVTIEGKTFGNNYDCYVRSYCSATKQSDPLMVQFTPSCVAPSALEASAITGGSATISWTSKAGKLRYKAGSGDWSYETLSDATSFNLTGLTGSTTYTVQVQAACAANENEYWSAELEFTTKCALASAEELPLNEDFSAGVKPECWEFIATGEYPIISNNKIWFQGENEQIVVFPGFDINLNELAVSFDYTASNASIELGYIPAAGGAFQSLGAYTSGKLLDLTSAPAVKGNLAIRYYDATQSWSTGSVDNVHVTRHITLADNVNNTATLETWADKTLDVTIGRTFQCADYYNTICLPFDLPTLTGTPLDKTGVELWAFKYINVDEDSLYIRIIEAESIEAGVPYLIKWPNGDNIVNPTFEDVTIAAANGKNVGDGNLQFRGILSPETFNSGDKTKLFVAAENKLYWWNGTNDSKLNGFRAYFYVNTNNTTSLYHGMPARIVRGTQVATGCENVLLDAQALKLIENGNVVIIRNGVKYNIQGQVISK